MKNTLAILAVFGIATSCATAQSYTRIDVNGNLTSSYVSPAGTFGTSTVLPTGWSKFGPNGTVQSTYDSTVALNTQNQHAVYEADGTIDGGGGVKFGDSLYAGQTKYGIYQTFQSVAGKVYYMTAAQNWTNSPNMRPYFGISAGAAITTGGYEATFSNTIVPNAYVMGKLGAGLNYSAIGTGGMMTAFIGVSTKSATLVGSSYIDGVRLYEIDPTVNNALVNGDMTSTDATATNLTNWNGGQAGDGSFAYWERKTTNGWIQMGKNVAQASLRQNGVAGTGTHTSVLDIWQGFGNGRDIMMQCVKANGATTVSADIFGQSIATNVSSLIGVDFTGGIDPYAASVTWSSAVNAAKTWQNKLVAGNAINGKVSIFLSTGNLGTTGLVNQGTGAQFDNIVLTTQAVPEPGSLLALGTGLVGLFGMIRRKK